MFFFEIKYKNIKDKLSMFLNNNIALKKILMLNMLIKNLYINKIYKLLHLNYVNIINFYNKILNTQNLIKLNYQN
jgi:hypothetical protein